MPLRPAFAVSTAVSSALWTVTVLDTAGVRVVPDNADDLMRAGAMMSGAVALVLWKTITDAQRAASLRLLVRTIASVTRPAAGERDLRLVREAGADSPPAAPVRRPR